MRLGSLCMAADHSNLCSDVKKIYLIAGESSGDQLGAALMRELKDAAYFGVGGEQMEAAGLQSLFPYHELSLMGFAEVLPHLLHLTARINAVVEDVLIKQPDVVVTIDSPGFNFRVVKKLRERGVRARFVHLVAPSVWAYKPERAAKTAKLFDTLGVLLPFEPPFFEHEGLPTTFIGHPVATRPRGNGAAYRAEKNIPETAPVIALLAGSRSNELRRHMPIFGAAISKVAEVLPQLQLVVPLAERLMPEMLPYFEGCPFPFHMVTENKSDAIASANVALTKSGTVTLDVAAEGTPMVVAYRANPISAWIVKRMINIPNVCLINIIVNKPVIPEYIQEFCTVDNLAGALMHLLADAPARAAQQAAMREAVALLTPPEGKTTAQCAADLIPIPPPAPNARSD